MFYFIQNCRSFFYQKYNSNHLCFTDSKIPVSLMELLFSRWLISIWIVYLYGQSEAHTSDNIYLNLILSYSTWQLGDMKYSKTIKFSFMILLPWSLSRNCNGERGCTVQIYLFFSSLVIDLLIYFLVFSNKWRRHLFRLYVIRTIWDKVYYFIV